MVADVDIIFERAIITLITFEFDHLRTLGHKLLKRTKLQIPSWADVMGIIYSKLLEWHKTPSLRRPCCTQLHASERPARGAGERFSLTSPQNPPAPRSPDAARDVENLWRYFCSTRAPLRARAEALRKLSKVHHPPIAAACDFFFASGEEHAEELESRSENSQPPTSGDAAAPTAGPPSSDTRK